MFAQAKTASIAAGETIRPLRDRIVIKPLEPEPGALIVIDSGRKPIRGHVVAVGPGAYRKKYWLNDQGERCKVGEITGRIPTELKPGQLVELLPIRPNEITIGGELHLLCAEGDVAGVICADAY